MRNQGCFLRLVGALFSLVLSLVVLGGVAFVFLRSEGGSLDTFFSTLTNIASLGTRTIIRPVVPVTQSNNPDLLITNYQLSGSPIEEALATPDSSLNRGIPILMTMTGVQDGRRVVLWERQVGTDEGGQQVNYTFDETAVYVTVNNKLYALNRQDGRERWGASISDAVDGLCGHCMAVAGDKIILLSLDSTLQTFNIRNGQALWAVRLNDANRSFSAKHLSQFIMAGGQVALLDDVKTETGTLMRALVFYDAETGKLRSQLSPTCESTSEALNQTTAGLNEANEAMNQALDASANAPQEASAALNDALNQMTEALGEAGASIPYSFLNGGLDPWSTVLMDAAHDSTYFILGGTIGPGCVQRWQISTGHPLWSVGLPEGFSQDSTTTGGLYAAETAVPFWFSGETNLYLALNPSAAAPSVVVALDQATGEQRFILNETDYGLMPLAEAGDTLFVRGTKMRGTKRDEVWGVDVVSGKIRWQHPLQTDLLLGADIGIGNHWDYHLTSQGLAVIQLLPDPDRVIAQVLNAEGQMLNEATSNVGDDFWQSTAWTDDTAYLAIRDLFAVDLTSGQTKREWP